MNTKKHYKDLTSKLDGIEARLLKIRERQQARKRAQAQQIGTKEYWRANGVTEFVEGE